MEPTIRQPKIKMNLKAFNPEFLSSMKKEWPNNYKLLVTGKLTEKEIADLIMLWTKEMELKQKTDA